MPAIKITAKKHKNKTRTLVSFDPELIEQLKIWCKENNLTVSEVLNNLVYRKLNSVGAK